MQHVHVYNTYITYNVRSLGNKFSSVSEFITDNKLDLAAVTETWHLSQVITGDLHVYLENSTDPAALQLQLLLDSFGLVQHVNQPTHTHTEES